jgi:hypothetical protein
LERGFAVAVVGESGIPCSGDGVDHVKNAATEVTIR